MDKWYGWEKGQMVRNLVERNDLPIGSLGMVLGHSHSGSVFSELQATFPARQPEDDCYFFQVPNQLERFPV